jgi:hypothetical protein
METKKVVMMIKGWEILSLEEWKQRGNDDMYAGEVSWSNWLLSFCKL